jgi:hypothetical protein
LNPAWVDLIGDTMQINYNNAIADSRTWYDDHNVTNIYTHNEYKKMCKIPVKIWGAVDDGDVPYKVMPEIVNQLLNGGTHAEIKTVQTGGHSAFDVSLQYAQDITTALGINHVSIPIGWIELVRWIRQNTVKPTI